MGNERSSLGIVRALGSEGNFQNHQLVKNGRALFVCLKLVRAALFYAFCGGSAGAGTPPAGDAAVLVKGPNQLRLFSKQKPELEAEFGAITPIATSRFSPEQDLSPLPRISLAGAVKLIALAALLFCTRKARHLNLFYLRFFEAIEPVCAHRLSGYDAVACYNDQPFDIAAIVHAVNLQGTAKTIVFQHGLVLSEAFYFPAKAREFRAWGELSRTHYKALDRASHLVVSGRYGDDAALKAAQFKLPDANEGRPAILAAPSFVPAEIDDMTGAIAEWLGGCGLSDPKIAIKLHPATKQKTSILAKIRRALPSLCEETDVMEELAHRYDVLITKNSTSALDFMLLGKPVVFLEPRDDGQFPSAAYGFALDELVGMSAMTIQRLDQKNAARLEFLKAALNV
jgi:hypothetical protein